jgi:hypothetical protein
MNEQMCEIQAEFLELKNLILAQAPPERITPRLDALCIRVLWEIGLETHWHNAPIHRAGR